jgi:signal transduction histidine kinase
LHARLLAGTVAWIIIAVVVTGVLLADLFRRHVENGFETELTVHLNQLAAQATFAADGSVSVAQPLSDPRFRRPLSGLYWQIDGPDGPRRRSRSLWDQILRLPADTLTDGEVHRHRIEGPDGRAVILLERAVYPIEAAGPFRLIVAADASGMTEPIQSLTGTLAAALAVLALGLAAAAVSQIWIGLWPLKRVREAAAAVREGRSRHLDGQFPGEVQPLVDDLNALLEHDAQVVKRARTQAGNLAHALKTPLTVLANAARRGESGNALAETIEQQVALAQRQIDYHLARARAAAAAEVPGLRTPVTAEVEGLLRTLKRVHGERHLAFEVSVDDGIAFRGEREDLQEILGNILDNACKWAKGRVSVAATRADGRLVVTIEDDGAGLSDTAREAAFDRGRRLDESVPGSGLGLAIVRDLVELYAGTVALDVSPMGGLRVRLDLPAA